MAIIFFGQLLNGHYCMYGSDKLGKVIEKAQAAGKLATTDATILNFLTEGANKTLGVFYDESKKK